MRARAPRLRTLHRRGRAAWFKAAGWPSPCPSCVGEWPKAAAHLFGEGHVRLIGYSDEGRPCPAPSLEPGELIGSGAYPPDPSPSVATPEEINWPAGMVSFDDAPLNEIAGRSNAVNFMTIVVHPAVSQRRATGAFEAGDPPGPARSLSASIGLSLRRLPDGRLLLKP